MKEIDLHGKQIRDGHNYNVEICVKIGGENGELLG